MPFSFNHGYLHSHEASSSEVSGFPFPKIKEATALYLAHFLRTFSLSLPGIYTPIFIFGLTNKPIISDNVFLNNIFWVLVYYLGYAVFVSLANIFLANFLFQKLGFRTSILLSMLFLIGLIATFVFAEKNFWFIVFGSVFAALSVHFYWIPFHVFFLRKANDGGNFGNESASLLLAATVAGALGPLVAGLILKFFDFNILFLLTSFLLLLSSLPILFLVNDTKHGEHKFKKIFLDYVFNHRFKKLNLAFVGSGIDGMLFDIFWPILLFLVLQDFVKLGGLVSFSAVFSTVIMVWVGRLLENKKAGLWRKGSVVINSLLYFPRIFVIAPTGLFAIDVIDRFNGKIYATSILAESYDRIKSMNVSESDFIIYRETIIHLGQIAGLLMALIIIFSLANWKLVFLIPGLTSLLVYLLYL